VERVDANNEGAWRESNPRNYWWSTDWGYNEWNRNAAGQLANGGQVIGYPSWTIWQNNAVANNTVPYTWGGFDTPFAILNKFNAQHNMIVTRRTELRNQHRQLRQEALDRVANGEEDVVVPPENPPGAWWTEIYAENGVQRTAPGGAWTNYVFSARRWTPQGEILAVGVNADGTRRDTFAGQDLWNHGYNTPYGPAVTNVDLRETYLPRWEYHVDDQRIGDTPVQYTTGNISVPGLSIYYYNTAGLNYEFNQRERSIGVDCSGFVSRAAVYEGRSYAIGSQRHTVPLANGRNGLNQGDDDVESFQLHPAPWDLAGENITEEQRDRQRYIASLAVPGDYIVLSESHVSMVQSINIPFGQRTILDYTHMGVIHSSNANFTWQVALSDWEDQDRGPHVNYQLRRFR